MSENYVFGFKLNMQSLARLRGSKDTQFVEGVLKADADSVKEIDDLFRDYADRPDDLLTCAQVLDEIVMNRLSKDHVYHYRRCLELLAYHSLGLASVQGLMVFHRDCFHCLELEGHRGD